MFVQLKKVMKDQKVLMQRVMSLRTNQITELFSKLRLALTSTKMELDKQ